MASTVFSVPSISLEGELGKAGGLGGQTFNTRYFVLDGCQLFHYKSKIHSVTQAPKDILSLIGAALVSINECTFELTFTAHKKFLLRASSEQVKNEWVDNLQQIIKLTTVPHWQVRPVMTACKAADKFDLLLGEEERLTFFCVSVGTGVAKITGNLVITNYRVEVCGSSLPLGQINSAQCAGRSLILSSKLGVAMQCMLNEEIDADIAVRKIRAPILPFAFAHYNAREMHKAGNPSAVFVKSVADTSFQYDPIKEFKRMGVYQDPHCEWQLDCTTNAGYRLCSTYPAVLCVPRKATPSLLVPAAEFRTHHRLPILCWRCPQTQRTICRSAEPGTVGFARKADIQLLELIREASHVEQMVVVDCRSQTAAFGNFANIQKKRGGSEWCYPNCGIEYCGIPNIHRVREAHEKLVDGDSKLWLDLIQEILKYAVIVSHFLVRTQNSCSVLIHCTDGWDRTSQLCCLVEILMDPYYRTLTGFATLIEKDWLSTGHKFADRCGNHVATEQNATSSSDQSPVFLQFLWCVYQLTKHFTSHFEFNSDFLKALAEFHTCQLHGTFLGNNERERSAGGVACSLSSHTVSIWHDILHPDFVSCFVNKGYRIYDRRLDFDPMSFEMWTWNIAKTMMQEKREKYFSELFRGISSCGASMSSPSSGSPTSNSFLE